MAMLKRVLSATLALALLLSCAPAWTVTATAAETEETTITTEAPVEGSTEAPTEESTEAPTEAPAEESTEAPTEAPTEESTEAPTEAPPETAEEPTEEPTQAPTEPVETVEATAAQEAVNATTSGTCGENVTWTFDDSTGMLTISGNGAMEDYTSSLTAPWYSTRSEIKSVVIQDGVTSIGNLAFDGCRSLTSISIPEGVQSIGTEAFSGCVIKQIVIPASVTSIGTDALASNSLQKILFMGDAPDTDGTQLFGDKSNSGPSRIVFYPAGNTTWDSAVKQTLTGECGNISWIGCDTGLPTSGSCGADLSWSVDLETKTLTISGTGSMDAWDWTDTFAPWTYYYDGIETVVFEPGITSISDNAFQTETYNSFDTFRFQGNAPEVGAGVFDDYSSLTVYYPANNSTWDEMPQRYPRVRWIQEGSALANLEEIMAVYETMTAEEIRAAVQALDYDELLASMRAGDAVYDLSRLETAIQAGYPQVVVTPEVPELYEADTMWYGIHPEAAGLNNLISTDEPVTLVIDKVGTALPVPEGYDSSDAVQFSISLENVHNQERLVVPVHISMVCPVDGNAFFADVFWRNNETGQIEKIPSEKYYSKEDVDDMKIDFVITGAGDYCIVTQKDASVGGSCGDQLTWLYDADKVLTISGSGEMYDYGMNSDLAPWVSYLEHMDGIVIEDGVTSIGAYAFNNIQFAYQVVDRIVIPASVRKLGDGAFYAMPMNIIVFEGDAPEVGQNSLDRIFAEVYYPAGNTTWASVISQPTWAGANELEWVEMPSGNACGEHTTWAFDETTGVLTISGTGRMEDYESAQDQPWGYIRTEISRVELQPGVTSIGSCAFKSCISLTSVSIPEGVESIGDRAFYGCGKRAWIGYSDIGLTEVAIPGSVDSIGAYAFANCYVLTCVTMGNGVTSIGEYAFEYCSSLTDITLSNTLTSIGDYAFGNCVRLESITIPGSVTYLGKDIFLGYETNLGMKTVMFQGDAPQLDTYTLSSVHGTIYYPANNSTWTADVMQDFNGFVTWVAYDTSSEPATSGACGENVDWAFDEATGTLTISGTGAMADYGSSSETPWNFFRSDITGSQITRIVIRDGVTSIGDNAFGECYGLTSITIPDGVASIGKSAFEWCSDLTGITIPDSVTSIGDGAFMYCESLTSVAIPYGVTRIGENTFSECTSLRRISLPDGIVSIGGYAFDSCNYLDNVTIPASVTSIGGGAFSACLWLDIITFLGDAPQFLNCEDGWHAGSPWTFANVTATAYYPAGNDTWTEDVMQDYGGTITWEAYDASSEPVTSGSCGENVTWAFDEATGTLTISGSGDMYDLLSPEDQPWKAVRDQIESVYFSGDVTSIGAYAFAGFENLLNIGIAKSVEKISFNAFDECTSLIYISTGIEHPCYYGYDGILYSADKTTLLCVPRGLRVCVIQESVTTVGKDAFRTCAGLSGIVFQGDAPQFESTGVFEGITATVYYPAGNATWTEDVMQDYGGTITWAANSSGGSPTSGVCGESATWAFDKATGTLTISGTGAMEDYATDGIDSNQPWECFQGEITSVKIEEGITRIGDHAFYYLYELTNVEIPEGVTEIGERAFGSCGNLPGIDIPQSVTSIGECAFALCFQLTDVVIPYGVTQLPNGLFSCCAELASVTIPESVTTIGESAFSGCANLSDVVIPNSVSEIGDMVFSHCQGLASVTIPESVKSIGSGAFYDCLDDLTLYFKGDAPTIGEAAFDYTTAVAFYPANNPTWTEDVMQGYGGGVMWVPDGSFPPTSGTCGENATWSFDLDTGTLTISGSGNIDDKTQPWVFIKKHIKNLVIEEGITGIGEYAFIVFRNMVNVSIAEGVETIGDRAFANCGSLETVTMMGSVATVGEYAFSDCTSLNSITFSGDAPQIQENAFYNITATAYYPAGNSTWTEDVMQDYGGTITWVAYGETLAVPAKPYKVINVATGIQVYWEAVEDAAGYGVWRSEAENGEYALLTTATSTLYTDTEVDPGQTYYYRISAMDDSGEHTDKSDSVSITFVTAPKVVAATSGAYAYWTAIPGAAEYGVWCSKNGINGDFELLGTTTATNYTNRSVPSGTTYYYAISIVNADGTHSALSKAINHTFLSTPSITSRTNVAEGVKLTWNKINGALGYAIYRKTYTSSVWTRVHTVTEGDTLTWTDTSVRAKNGQAYHYTIRALAGSKLTIQSAQRINGTPIVRLTAQTLKSTVRISSTAIKCAWNTSSVVTGYEVRLMSGGNVYKSYIVPGKTTSTKALTGLPRGRTYTVQIRTYKTLDAGTYYSAWSNARSVTLP